MYGMFFSLIELSTLHSSTIDQVDFQVWSCGYKSTHTLTVINHFLSVRENPVESKSPL